MRAVLDANVLVSALISRGGAPAQLLEAWRSGSFELVVSRGLLAELRRVFEYPKLVRRLDKVEADAFVEALRADLLAIIDERTGEPLVRSVRRTADLYDGDCLDRLPDLQERIAHEVVAITAPYGPIFEAELARARRSAEAPKLGDCNAAYHEYRRRVNPAGYSETLACLRAVSARQPDIAPVWANLAMLYVDGYASSFGRTGDAALQSAWQATEKALALDINAFYANLALTRLQFFDGDPAFRASIDRTIALRPNNAQAFAQGGFLLVITVDAAHGLALTEESRGLPKSPLGF